MLVIHYSIQGSRKLDATKKQEAIDILTAGAEKLYQHLQYSAGNTLLNFKEETDAIMRFVDENREFISTRTLTRIIRYLKDVLDGATYLLSLTRHRTIMGLRFYALVFIHVFIVLNAPILVSRMADTLPTWMIYSSSVFGTLILITLYNLQVQIEYPFDQKGADDIKLGDYKLNI